MDKVVTGREVKLAPPLYAALLAYAGLAILFVPRHEPWADEAQSWLLARDTSLGKLWGHSLHYEGSPGLWQTLLHVLIRAGLPYSALGFVCAAFALVAAYLLLRYAPFPLFVRILLPFTYFVAYQYGLIARSYALIAPLLFAIAALYLHARTKMAWMTVLLVLLAAVSVHGFLVSVCIWSTLYGPWLLRAKARGRGTLAIASSIYACILVLLLASAWPASDVAFAEHRGLANLRLLPDVVKAGLSGAFIGNWITAVFLIALSAPLLWRGGGWLFFLLASAALFLFGTIVYAQLWHFGVLFLVWLFAIWISARKTRLDPAAVVALTAAIGVQGYWTASAVHYDWAHAYSGSRAAAAYFKQSGLPAGGLYAVGYPSTAIEPYFASNIYSDFRAAYFDWSKANTANDPAALCASNRRELVLVGYKALYEKQHWAGLLALLGYSPIRHFEGGTFWQTHVFEFESYDLYRETSPPHAASIVKAADPAQAAQLLTGFYDIEGGKSRWTAKSFSALLRVPPGSVQNGAALSLRLYVPDGQIQHLGAMTLRADAGGVELPAQTFSKSGEYTYSARMPAAALQTEFVVVNFRLDKSSSGLNGDARELGVVVTEVGLSPPSPAQ